MTMFMIGAEPEKIAAHFLSSIKEITVGSDTILNYGSFSVTVYRDSLAEFTFIGNNITREEWAPIDAALRVLRHDDS